MTRPVRVLPARPHAHQRQRLRHVVAAGAHVGGAPGRERDAARIVAVLLRVALEQERRRFPAELPRRRRRHRAGVERIEIAPRRQHLGPAARSARPRARRHEAPVEAAQEPGDLGRCRRRRRSGRKRARRSNRAPRGSAVQAVVGARASPATSAQREKLQPLDRVAGAAPGASPASAAGRGPCQGAPRSAASGSNAEPEIVRRARGSARPDAAPRRAAGARAPPADRSSCAPSGARPKMCSPSRICISFSSQR